MLRSYLLSTRSREEPTSVSALIFAAWIAAAAAPPSLSESGGPAPLEFRELLEPAITPRLSARVRALDGQRIRLVGYMAQLEEPPNGAFYLVPRPLFCDEGGGGTADLPLDAVRVLVRSSPDVPIRFIPGPLEVTGVLRVGNRPDGEGRVSALELVLDTLPAPPAPQQDRRSATTG
jgi:hypothetical protein